MTWEDIAALLDAERFAAEQNMPLTACLTVTWESSPSFNKDDPKSWDKHHRELIKAIKSHLAKLGIPLAYVFAREILRKKHVETIFDGTNITGSHTHLMLHFPSRNKEEWEAVRTSLTEHLQSYLTRRLDLSDPKAVFINPLWRNAGPDCPNQRLGLLKYLGKSLNPRELIATGFGTGKLSKFLGIVPKPHEPLPCKRVGWSANIGEAARLRDGFRDMKTKMDLARALPDTKKPKTKVKTKTELSAVRPWRGG